MISENIQRKAGDLIINLLKSASNNNLCYVYLRNYESLPESIGNDIDLLVYPNDLQAWKNFIKNYIKETDWDFYKIEHHSCECIFLQEKTSKEIIHIDLNTFIEYHFMIYASTHDVLSNRIFNRNVYTPSLIDELYINIMTRLLYQGVVREKHREQWERNLELLDDNKIKKTFELHFGTNLSNIIISPAKQFNWSHIEKSKNTIRLKLLNVCLFKRPIVTTKRFLALLKRIVCRLTTKK